MTPKPMRVISLGWGVQSFALAAMSAVGVLPPVDVAIHADTGWERRETIEFAERWTPWLEARGVRVATVTGNRNLQITDRRRGVFIPAFTKWKDSKMASGTLRRQCTQDWKIAPIRRWLQASRSGRQVEQWLGITLDEARRMAPSRVGYIVNHYPFIDMLTRPISRRDAILWLQDNDLEIPIKSSCIICPYHDLATWRAIKLSSNGDWERAVEVDRAIRNRRPGYTCYLSAQRKPLDECDFRNEQDHGQLELWPGIEDEP